MEVLHITGEFPPFVSGGLATYASEVVSRLKKRHNVEVLLLKGNDDHYNSIPDSRTDANLTVVEFDTEALKDQNMRQIDTNHARAIIEDIPVGKFDVIHVHDWYGVLGSIAATKDTDTPIVISSHLPLRSGFTYSGHPVSERIKGQLEALGFRISDRVLAPSKFVARVLQREYNVSSDQITVIPNGVDTDRFKPRIRRHEKLSESVTVTTVSRLTEQKGIPYLLDAVSLMSDTSGIDVEVYGDGPRRTVLERMAKDRRIYNDINFCGFVPESSLVNTYRAADIFAFPSVYEPFGLVVLEAMASGTPVVAFDAGGVREIIRDGTDGLLIRPGDTDAFQTAIEELANEPERRDMMGSYARERAKTFEWDRTVSALETTYRNLVSLVKA